MTLQPLPFKLSATGRDSMGLDGIESVSYQSDGLLHLTDTGLLLEWTETRTSEKVSLERIGTDVTTFEPELLELPFERLAGAWVIGGWWWPRLELRAATLDDLAGAPGARGVTLVLKIHRRDRETARAIAAEVQARVALGYRVHMDKADPSEWRTHGVLLAAILAGSAAALPVQAQAPVTFRTEDGASIEADHYGSGMRGVVLAHGGRFDKGSWGPQAHALAGDGFQVLAFNFRGKGASYGPGDADPYSAPLYLDVLGAVAWLRQHGARSVAVVGGSMGGTAAAEAAARTGAGVIDRIVLLASPTGPEPRFMQGCKLFVIADNDTTASGAPRLVKIREQYELVPEPKRMLVIPGTAHAQALFDTDEGVKVLSEIRWFLEAPQC